MHGVKRRRGTEVEDLNPHCKTLSTLMLADNVASVML